MIGLNNSIIKAQFRTPFYRDHSMAHVAKIVYSNLDIPVDLRWYFFTSKSRSLFVQAGVGNTTTLWNSVKTYKNGKLVSNEGFYYVELGRPIHVFFGGSCLVKKHELFVSLGLNNFRDSSVQNFLDQSFLFRPLDGWIRVRQIILQFAVPLIKF
jgi:hypothetical protein